MPPHNPNYSNTWMYYIQIGDKRYFGHSTQNFGRYQSFHRYTYRRALAKGQLGRKLYKDLHEANMTPEDIELVFIEHYPCNDGIEARCRERYWTEQYDADKLSNQVKPFVSPEETKERVRQSSNKNYHKHMDRIREMNGTVLKIYPSGKTRNVRPTWLDRLRETDPEHPYFTKYGLS
jgi:hypothetical protein